MTLKERCRVLRFADLGDERGKLVVVEGGQSIPFDIQRVFYIYESDESVVRGQHANKESEFVLINVAGKSKVRITDGVEDFVVELNEPMMGVYIPKMVWKDMYDFSADSVLLVLASTHYDDKEYIRDYDSYMNIVKDGKMSKYIDDMFIEDMKKRLFYFDTFKSWKDAETEGRKWGNLYQDESIFEQVKNAIEKVRRGEGLYEQDGIVFNKMVINYELISSILYLCTKKSSLRLVDFGGSLGSTYFRYKKLFEELDINWTVVEQEHYVKYGKEHITEIDFKQSINECNDEIDVVLFSSVLSYLENPYSILQEVIERNVKYIIIDEQAFSASGVHEIRLQNVPEHIYKAVYPVHLFSLIEFRKFFEERNYQVWDWDYRFGNIPIRENEKYTDTFEKGFFISLVK